MRARRPARGAMDSFLEEEEETTMTKKKAAAGSALLPALHLPFLPPQLYQPGKGAAARRLPALRLPPRSGLEGGTPPSAPAVPGGGEAGPPPASLPSRFAVGLPPGRRLGFPVAAVPLPASLRRPPPPPAACEALEGGVFAARKIRADEVADNKRRSGGR